MRLLHARRYLLPLLAVLLLGACHGNDDASPTAALKTSIALVKAGDFNGFWKHALPAADYANLRSDWREYEQNKAPITAADRARFNDALQKLTAPDAETRLYAELQPELAAMEQKYKDQLPVLISVGQALVKNGIEQSKQLTATQKTQTNAMLDVVTPWAQQTPWFDQAKARQAVHVAVTTARQLDLKSPEQLRTLDFDAAMGRYATGFSGIKQLLAIYGLSVDDTLDSVKLTEQSSSKGHTVVKIDYLLLGKPLSTETTMIEQDGHWYSEDLLKNVRESHRQLTAQAASLAPAPTSTAAPATASTVATKD